MLSFTEQQCDIPVIIVSGTIGEEIAVESLKLGADDYLLKGNLTRLESSVNRSLILHENRRRIRKDEEELRASEARYRAVFQSTFQFAALLSPDGSIIEVNESALRATGDRLEDLRGQPFWTIPCLKIDSQTPEQFKAAVQRAAKGESLKFEADILAADGAKITIEFSIKPAFDDQGEVRYLIPEGHDITQRKRQEAELLLAVQRSELATASGEMGIWELDVAGLESSWDQQTYRLFGVADVSTTITVDLWRELIHPQDSGRVMAYLNSTLWGSGKAYEDEFRIISADSGQLRHLKATGSVIRDKTGTPLRLIGIIWDVTRARLREQSLADALETEKELVQKAQAGEKAKSEFLAVMSHEIRTPMNGILGFADLLKESQALPEECTDYVHTISESAHALLRIIDDILDFSRLESGRIKIESVRFSPTQVATDIVALLQPVVIEKGLELNLTAGVAALPAFVKGDAGRVRQILLNLVGNALKFTERGSVTIDATSESLSSSQTRISFLIRDTGPGMTPADLKSIFEPFTQIDSTHSRRFGGSGLGLTISRRLAEAMNGSLVGESEPGIGSCFTVTVPVSIPLATDSPSPQLSASPLDKSFAEHFPLSLLVVEDDRINLKLIRSIAKKLGYEPFTAQHGKEAIEVFHESRPDCVLMDIQMPEMDGIDATRRIREFEKDQDLKPAFIAALTADTIPADRKRCFEAGMDDFLTKPVKHRDLSDLLARASQRSESEPGAEVKTETIP